MRHPCLSFQGRGGLGTNGLGGDGMKKRVLLAVDGSPGGSQAIAHVAATAAPDNTEITLVYVIE